MDNERQKKRIKIRLQGAVQGVGFRPFVWRLAKEMGVFGWVINGVRGVEIEAEGEKGILNIFLSRLSADAPATAQINSIESSEHHFLGYEDFEIRESDNFGEKTALILPDMATCPECQGDIFDPNNRRYRYPFTNCTNCGPRFSIIKRVPYDRPNTSMDIFPMCPECEVEYKDPGNRRFYAQPNACSVCGPSLELWNKDGLVLSGDSIMTACDYLRDGYIVAMKGLGGFHILVDARNQYCVNELRKRKGRSGAKPFAVMYPSLEMVKMDCYISVEEEKLLLSREAPIVILERKKIRHPGSICEQVSPGIRTLGVMLPYTPLHHLLMKDLGFPIVATSGNLSDEPIVIDENDALATLRHIADIFLVHNRPIVRHVDDSIMRICVGVPTVVRRARGFAPFPIKISKKETLCLTAFGSHLKNTGANLFDGNVFLTQHIGDMGTVKANDALERAIVDTLTFYGRKPDALVCDLHPEYSSTKMAKVFSQENSVPLFFVQHHEAHVFSCLTENDILGECALGVAFDGSGYGRDGTVWGGEFFVVKNKKIKRVGHIQPLILLGGDAAAREPKRVASAMLFELFGGDVFADKKNASICALSENERKVFPKLLSGNVGVFRSTSVGRLFDAVSSLLNICHMSEYEGHAAILLEQAINGFQTEKQYHFGMREVGGLFVFGWSSVILEILSDIGLGVSVSEVSAKFHNTMIEIIVCAAKKTGEKRVALSGGCFQNKYLLEKTILRLRCEKKIPYFQQRVPSGDGGISLGQIAAIISQQ
jgi:hydrogenase maturation protein HypF